jgi:N-acetyl-alpha-D-muramate 1-phosphate uridylyltransferase
LISRRKAGRVAPFVYTGIQLISRRFLRDAPIGPFSTNILWDRTIAEGRLFGLAHQGLWFEVGTPEAIPVTEAALRGD